MHRELQCDEIKSGVSPHRSFEPRFETSVLGKFPTVENNVQSAKGEDVEGQSCFLETMAKCPARRGSSRSIVEQRSWKVFRP